MPTVTARVRENGRTWTLELPVGAEPVAGGVAGERAATTRRALGMTADPAAAPDEARRWAAVARRARRRRWRVMTLQQA